MTYVVRAMVWKERGAGPTRRGFATNVLVRGRGIAVSVAREDQRARPAVIVRDMTIFSAVEDEQSCPGCLGCCRRAAR